MLSPHARPTSVCCPRCGGAPLVLERSCLATRFFCPACGRRCGLEALARELDDAGFAALAELVDDRLSDRV